HPRRVERTPVRGGETNWGHSPWKNICFSMRAVSAYWGHLTAKSSETSTNGLDCSESRRCRHATRQEAAALRDFTPVFVRYGSFASDRDVSRPAACPLWPESGQMAVNLGMSASCQRQTLSRISAAARKGVDSELPGQCRHRSGSCPAMG